MNKFFRLLMVMAIVAAAGFLSSDADADWVTGATERNILVQTTTASRDSENLDADIVYQLNAGDALAAQDTIRVTLTGGAIFNNNPTLTPDNGIDVGAGNAAAAPPLMGGAGENYAVWRVVDPGAGMAGSNLEINTNGDAALFDVTGVAVGSNSDALLTLKTQLGDVIGQENRSYESDILTFLFNGVNAFTTAIVTQDDTADVSAANGPFELFLGDVVAGTATTATVTNESGAATIPTTVNAAAETILYTLTGDFTGIAAVNAANLTGSSSAGDTTNGAANEFLINDDLTAAYAVNTAALGGGNVLAPGPQFKIDGVTPQAARTFTLTIQKLAEGPWLANTFLPTELHYTIDRNGATRRLLNVPSSTDASGDKPFIRITNPTDRVGDVFGTMWDVNGNIIGTAATVMVNDMAANTTQTFNVSALEALFGTWEGRARLQIDAELEDLGAMGLIRNTSGNLNNYSSGAANVDNW